MTRGDKRVIQLPSCLMLLRSRWILRTKPQPIFFNHWPSTSIAGFSSGSAEQSEKMEDGGEDRPKPQTNAPAEDIMADSFGHGYSTRSDDDGFGGIYGSGNQSLGEKSVAEEEEKKQGSQAKQREGEGAAASGGNG